MIRLEETTGLHIRENHDDVTLYTFPHALTVLEVMRCIMLNGEMNGCVNQPLALPAAQACEYEGSRGAEHSRKEHVCTVV